MGREKLNEQQVAEAVAKLPGWSIRNGVLHREFVFKDFAEAFGFMTRVALAAEAMNIIRTGRTRGIESASA